MSSYFEYFPTLLPGRLGGLWGARWAQGIALELDLVLGRVHDAVRARMLPDAPADAVDELLYDRALDLVAGETTEARRARVGAAWTTWSWAASGKAVRDALVLYGLHGVQVVGTTTWPIDANASLWARFRVYVTGFAASGEVYSGLFNSGAYLNPGHGIAPLISGQFNSGQYVSGTTATAVTAEAVRALVRKWKASRDRAHGVVFTWGGSISGAFYSGTVTGVGAGNQPPVTWRHTDT